MDKLPTWEDPEETRIVQRQPSKDIYHQTVFDMWEGGVRDLEEIRLETGYTTAYIRMLLNTRGYEVSTVKARPDAEIEQICNDYMNPKIKVRQVLRKWSISLNTLYTILEERNVPLRRSAPSRRSQDLERAVQMYTNGHALKEIRNETGVNVSDLYTELDLRGITLRVHSTVNDEVVAQAVEMYNNSPMTVSEITAETGVPLSRLYKAAGRTRRDPKSMTERLDKAVDMYLSSESVNNIQSATGIGTSVLYKELATRNISSRRDKAQGDIVKALDMYDKGAKALEIRKVTSVTLAELLHQLRKRGGKLRTGLPKVLTTKNLEYAIDEYQHNVDIETIEIDTLVTRPELYAALRRKGIAIRP